MFTMHPIIELAIPGDEGTEYFIVGEKSVNKINLTDHHMISVNIVEEGKEIELVFPLTSIKNYVRKIK